MSSMFCKKIYQCKNADWCARDFNPKSDGAPKCFEPMTNADKVRQMTDDELARWIARQTTEGGRPIPNEEYEWWLDWLKQEVESDG